MKGNIRLSRYQAQKHKLKNIVKVFDESKSEIDNMRTDGWLRCEDCGNYKFEKQM